MALNLEPWLIPTDSQLEELETLMPTTCARRDYAERRINHFSAAAWAIRFVEQIRPNLYSHSRRLVIRDECIDNPFGISNIHIHAQGLIPLYQANPRLQIDHEIDLWRTVLVKFFRKSKESMDITFSRDFKRWIGEAFRLGEIGMPLNAYSTVFRTPSRTATQQICDVVKKTAALADAR
jgi:hypothetical protein